MNFISRRIKTEWGHFKFLNYGSKVLLLAYVFYLMAQPMLGVFVNAYLWRQSESLNLIIAYSLGMFIGLPIAFYLNGLILRKIHIKKMYFIGTMLQGLGAALAIFQTSITLTSVGLFGLIYGFGTGFFWANKNFLAMILTKGQNRVYYNALEHTFNTLINIVVPMIIGWIIAYGEIGQRYSVDDAYRGFIILALGILLAGGNVIFSSKIKDEFSGKLFLSKVSKTWWMVRFYNIFYQATAGLNFFLPGVLILYLLGNEGILGTIQSVASLISAIVLYWVGRKLSLKDSPKIVFWTNVIHWLGAVFLAWNFSAWGIIILMLALTLSASLGWVMSYPILMEVMDREDGKRDENYQYAYVADNELFFNVGRILGLITLILFLQVSQDFALRFIPLVIASIQFVAWIFLKKIAREVSS